MFKLVNIYYIKTIITQIHNIIGTLSSDDHYITKRVLSTFLPLTSSQSSTSDSLSSLTFFNFFFLVVVWGLSSPRARRFLTSISALVTLLLYFLILDSVSSTLLACCSNSSKVFLATSSLFLDKFCDHTFKNIHCFIYYIISIVLF